MRIRSRGYHGETEQYHNITVVYTKEAETADSYIEKATLDLSKKHKVRVATSDGMEQLIILGKLVLSVSLRRNSGRRSCRPRQPFGNMRHR